MNKYGFWSSFLGVLIISLEVSQNVFLVKEIQEINLEYASFMEHNFGNSNYSNSDNYSSLGDKDYPYKIRENNYLCKEPFNISDLEVKEIDKIGKFSNPEQIREDFANHAGKWRNLYLWTYWGIWSFQILLALYFLLVSFTLFLCEPSKKANYEKAVSLSVGYYLFTNWKLHLLLTVSFLQSAFIIFDFDDCITSSTPQEVAIIYTMKNWGIVMFAVGFALFFIYIGFLNAILSLALGLYDKRGCDLCSLIIINLITEGLELSDFLLRTLYFDNFNINFPGTINDLMNILIKECFYYRTFIGWFFIVAALIKLVFQCTTHRIGDINHEDRIGYINNGDNEQRLPERKQDTELKGTENAEIKLEGTESMMFCTICMDTLTPLHRK